MLTVTKREAVQALIRGAMRDLQNGDEVCALTLSGAAEEAMPRADKVTAFDVMKMVRSHRTGDALRDIGLALNEQRNWLKHHNPGEPDPMQIDAASWMLLRAISRYSAVYGPDDLTREYSDFAGYPPDHDP